MEKLEKHVYTHQLKKEGFNVAAIARKCGLSRTTVYSYLDMDFEQVKELVDELKTRQRKLDPYQDQIIQWLREHPDLSASQMADWLEEKCSFKDIGESTVRTYIRELRERYHIPKTLSPRTFEALEELPKGKQMQVDFGEIKVKDKEWKWVKLYVIAFVLSHSRYKYAEWQDRPFTTRDVLRSHENAFEYIGGMTEEIVYDQDKLMTVSENGGDLILTEAFQLYRQTRGFQVYLCRKADPQSKGKIENVVKFIKGNFAKNRIFYQIETWNEQCLAWLKRKGNYQVHNTIKKRPVEVFALEKPHLRKVSSLLSFESHTGASITRMVHKDNIIKLYANRYSVPLGTYHTQGDNTVYVEIVEHQVFIRKTPVGEPIAVHPFSYGKGQLIKNTNHARDRSKGIPELLATVKEPFEDQEKIRVFLEKIQARYPRYIRDQCQILQRAMKTNEPWVQQALDICMEKNRWSANDFQDVIQHLAKTGGRDERKETIEIPLTKTRTSNAWMKEKATVRDLKGYIKILGG